MRSLEVLPCKQLRPYVSLYWILEVDEPEAFGPPERIGPDGLVELVFHYRTPLSCRYDGEAFEQQQRSVAVSQTRRFLEIQSEGSSGLVSVRFHPWGAFHFFSLPVSELADRQTPIEVLWGHEASELEQRLAEARGDRKRISLVERFLLAQFERHQKADVEPLIRAVWSHKGRIRISQLCRELGVSERQLQKTFAVALGTTPKGFTKLTRFLHACSLMQGGHLATLTEVGLACGYYDQSHFTADFKAFSGLTPGQFVEEANLSFLELV